MTTWQADKRWSDRFLPEIKAILGQTLMTEPPIHEDMERNTDLIVLQFDSVRVACRIRRNQYVDRYGDEFTIRAGRPSGTKTELAKVVEGWGDFIFYGFSDKEEKKLVKWFVGDLNVFRGWFTRTSLRDKKAPGLGENNKDGSSTFRAFNVKHLPKEFIKAEL